MTKETDNFLESLLVDEDEALTQLRSRLAERADLTGLLDVAYRTMDTPIGLLLLAATPDGLVRVAFAGENHEQVLSVLAERVSPRVLFAPGRLDEPAHQIEEYFAGRRRHFELAVDLRLASGFRRVVLEHLVDVGFGSTVSYASLAALTGRPRAVRAVGTACAVNPVPIVVPCHRVVRSDGTTGRYLGGSDVKRALLNLEAALNRSE